MVLAEPVWGSAASSSSSQASAPVLVRAVVPSPWTMITAGPWAWSVSGVARRARIPARMPTARCRDNEARISTSSSVKWGSPVRRWSANPPQVRPLASATTRASSAKPYVGWRNSCLRNSAVSLSGSRCTAVAGTARSDSDTKLVGFSSRYSNSPQRASASASGRSSPSLYVPVQSRVAGSTSATHIARYGTARRSD